MFSIVLKFVTTIQSYSYYSMLIRRQPSLPTLPSPNALIKRKTETKERMDVVSYTLNLRARIVCLSRLSWFHRKVTSNSDDKNVYGFGRISNIDKHRRWCISTDEEVGSHGRRSRDQLSDYIVFFVSTNRFRGFTLLTPVVLTEKCRIRRHFGEKF